MTRVHRMSTTRRDAVGQRPLRRRLAAVTAAAALAVASPAWFGLGAGTAAADGSGGDDEASSVPTMLVLDASGSMRTKDGDDQGSSRMTAAKQAATNLVDDLPDGAQLGLTIYGANTSSAKSAKAKGCQDVDVVTPVGKGNADELRSAISSAEASGYTPIGTSLKKAADALPKDGDRAIVLVSDGIDSCAPPPPCDVAKDLEQDGVDLTVHTIGFRVGDEARDDLSCIAEATGGQYSDAQDGEQLSDQLQQRTTRAMQGYEVSGDPIKGGDRIGKATEVKPGRYLDTLERGSANISRDGSEKYYKVEVPQGGRIHASATLVPPPGNAHWSDDYELGSKLDVVGQDGMSCADPVGPSGVGEAPSEAGDMPMVAAVSSKPGQDDSGAESCDADTLYLHLSRSGPAHKKIALPVELLVATEQAGAAPEGSADPKAIKDEKGAAPVPAKSEAPRELGRSFSDATAVKPGSFVTEMVPGDVRMVKIPVQEGQRLRYRFEAVDTEDAPSTDATDRPRLRVNFFNSLRMPTPVDAGLRTQMLTVDSDQVLAGGMSSVTRAANRDLDLNDSDTAVPRNWLGGDQYLMLNLSRLSGVDSDSKSVPVKVQVTLQVDGKAKRGIQLAATHKAPKNTAVNDQGEKKAVATEDTAAVGPGRTALTIGSIGAGVVAVAAAVGAIMLHRRRQGPGLD